MPDLESRIARALQELPESAPQVRERVVRRAAQIAPAPRSMRGRQMALAAAAAVAVAGAALAGTGTIRLSVGPAPRTVPPPESPGRVLTLPPGAHGIAVLAAGRVHVRTAGGVGIDGLRATAVELSPNARYVALGLRRSLTVLSTSGRRAWTQPTAGPVVAAAWAPNPIRIAYVVALPGGRHQLRVIEGDGDHDHPVAMGVVPSRPHWSPDGTRLYFARTAGALMTHHASTGRTVRGGPACGEACGVTEPPAVRRLRRQGATRVGFTRGTEGRVWALRAGGGVEFWWAPADPGAGDARLVMRASDAGGAVQVSLR